MKHPRLPSIQEFQEAFGIIPLSQLSISNKKYRFISKPFLVNNQYIDQYVSKASISQIAQALNTTVSIIRRMIKLYKEGGIQAIYRAKWGRGGLRDQQFQITEEQQSWATSQVTLRQQVGLNLKDRQYQFNIKFNKNISLKRFRKIYKDKQVRKKQINQRIGAPKMYPHDTQQSEIEHLQKMFRYYIQQKYEIVMADETLFNPDKYGSKQHWMMSNEPLMKVKKYCDKEKINVCCVINEVLGNIYNHYGLEYFNSEDMKEVLQAVRNKFDSNTKIMMFWDGASIHKSQEIRQFAEREDINIALCSNIRYRPDLQPVEKIFRRAKNDYAKELEQYKAHNHPWDQLETVKYIMNQIPNEFYISQARKLVKLINDAQPTIPLPTEKEAQLGFIQLNQSSPDKHYLEEHN